MGRKFAGDVPELLNRSDVKTKHTPEQRTKSQQVTQRPVEPASRRIYSGDPQSQVPGYAVRPANKATGSPKRRSTFNIIGVLFLSAIAIVVYIGNILTVNQLAVEVHLLQAKYERIVNNNNLLKAEINRKSAWERIGVTAKEQLGLTYAKERAQSFDVDESKLDEFKER